MNSVIEIFNIICNTSHDVNLNIHKKVVEDYINERKQIEEELGIDLTILFKALKSEVAYKLENGRINKVLVRTVGKCGLYVADRWCPYPECEYILPWEEYGTTWSLIREGLKR